MHKHVEKIDKPPEKRKKLIFRMENLEKKQEKINMKQKLKIEQTGMVMMIVLDNLFQMQRQMLEMQ